MTRFVLAPLLLLVFADNEVPKRSGVTLVLQHSPNPPASLELFRNGLFQTQKVDYSLAGAVITPKIPLDTQDSFRCFYRY